MKVSKYDALRDAMGSNEMWNDKGANGRILKWYADTTGATHTQRKAAAEKLNEKLKHLGYVQKVTIRNCTMSKIYGHSDGTCTVIDGADLDKIAVYIDNI